MSKSYIHTIILFPSIIALTNNYMVTYIISSENQVAMNNMKQRLHVLDMLHDWPKAAMDKQEASGPSI